jgi:hypothetical protein
LFGVGGGRGGARRRRRRATRVLLLLFAARPCPKRARTHRLNTTLPPLNKPKKQKSILDNNALTGGIPWAAAPMPSLYRLSLANNSGLCGAVPRALAGPLGAANGTTLNSTCPWEADGALFCCVLFGFGRIKGPRAAAGVPQPPHAVTPKKHQPTNQ